MKSLLPELKGSIGWGGLGKHYLQIILFTGLGYVIPAYLFGYFQEVENHYFAQFLLLLLGVVIGYFIQVGLHRLGAYMFHYWRTDKWFYPIAFIIAYMAINEIWGF